VPSRRGLMTGRHPSMMGKVNWNDTRDKLMPAMLKSHGYATAIIGKWHLAGYPPDFSKSPMYPLECGFDHHFGTPGSNDVPRPNGHVQNRALFDKCDKFTFQVPLIRNREVVEFPANQELFTKRYTEEAVKWIEANQDGPFFLYLAHNMPHTPVFASDDFYEKSQAGLYGDAVEEIDWSVGEIVKTLERLGLDDDTLVIFTSDNGPWLAMKQLGGSAGLLRDGKGTTWEGGMREPAIFYLPGKIEPKVVTGVGSGLDLLPTLAVLAGAELPTDREYDGVDLSETLLRGAPSPREHLFYWRFEDVFAVRKGRYKAHFTTMASFSGQPPEEHSKPLLFDLDVDPSEQFDIADQHPEVVAELTALVAEHKKTIEPAVNQLSLYPPGQAPNESGEATTKRPKDQF